VLKKKFFVTGSTGFIGERLVNFIDGDLKVLSRSKHPNYETVVCDLLTEEIPDDALEGIDVVFHLAGFTHDNHNEDDNADLYKKINVDATEKLAELAIRSGVKKFVFISSVKAGGLPLAGVLASEESQQEPDGIYGRTKRDAELKLLNFAKKSDMNISIIRSSLVYGPNLKGNLKLMLLGVRRGWFPPLPEIGNKKSMIHVDDLVRAIFLVSQDEHSNEEIFIATDGETYSSRKIYNIMCNVVGKKIPKWSIPIIFFNIISSIHPNIKYKVNKLFSDEEYSSTKLNALGFQPRKSLKEMNETDF